MAESPHPLEREKGRGLGGGAPLPLGVGGGGRAGEGSGERARWATLLAGAVLLLTLEGCLCLGGRFFCGSRPQVVRRAEPPRSGSRSTAAGLRLPTPQPYLLVQSRPEGGGVDVQVIYLPDASREIVLEPRGRKGRYRVTLDEAGLLREVSGRFKARRVIAPGAQDPEPAAPYPEMADLQLSELLQAGGLAPGLYRIVTAESGPGSAPRLEKVQLNPASPEEIVRVDAVLFRTCPAQPEVVRQIEVTADRGSLQSLAALAAGVRVYRAGKPAGQLIPEVRQRGIVYSVDPECQGGFQPYAVELPSAGLAPGSRLGAVFPSEEQLASLRPRAEVHLVKDEKGAPRYLIVKLDPGTGSPIPPLERLTRTTGLLLVNGRPARAAQIARELGAENLYAVDLGEPDVRSVFLLLTPRNAADLAGRPVAFSYAAAEPPPRPEKPPPISVRETYLETAGGRHNLTLGIQAPAGRLDVARTVAENQRRHWQGVRCASAGGSETTCSGRIAAGQDLQFQIYCTGEAAPCSAVDFAD